MYSFLKVGLAESTCVSVFPGNSTAGASLNIVDLSELGLERGVTARSTIQIMGALAETHGYYDAGDSCHNDESSYPNPDLI